MKSKFEKYQKRRLISSYFSVVLSIGLVLFLLGFLGLFVINSKKVTNHFKEQIKVSVFLKNSAKPIEISQLTKKLKLSNAVKHVTYVTKEEAAAAHSQEIGEDFIDFLGTNPLQNSLDINLKASYVTVDKLNTFVAEINDKTFVDEVVYDQPLISLLNDNIKKVTFWVLTACGVFTLIAVLLINNSIRLTIYAKRFTIKTMQMVGATKAFIRKPFISLNVLLGFFGGLLALGGMAVLLYFVNQSFPNFGLLENQLNIAVLFIGVFLLGIFITLVSTFFATKRFLSLQTDELYY